MIPTIPPEIVNEIISQLCKHSESVDLRSCSLVASSFREPSQRRLFRSIHLFTVSTTAATRNLLHILCTSPHLASYIRHIYLTVGHFRNRDIDAVCSILQLTAPHVKELTVEQSSIYVSWQNIHPDLQSSLIQALGSPSCASIALHLRNFPPEYLRQWAHLRHLNLTHAAPDPHDSDPWVSPGSEAVGDGHQYQGYLESLTLGSSTMGERLVRAFSNTPRLPSHSLSRLICCTITKIPQADTASFQYILDQASTSLQAVDIGINFDSSQNYFNLHTLNHLRILRIRIFRAVDSIDVYLVAGTWLTRVARTLPASIAELHLSLATTMMMRIERSAWREFDALVTHERHAGTLSLVVFRVLGGSRDEVPATGDAYRAFFEERTPGLLETGLLVLDCEMNFE